MPLRVALAQFNASVGDIAGNIEIMQRLYTQAVDLGADIVVFPEMSVCGYPPEDLLLKKHFLTDNRLALEELAKNCPDKTIIAGFAELAESASFNSLAVLENSRIKKIYRKTILPNYSVFDERRYFQPGIGPVVIDIDGLAVALTICEDIWEPKALNGFLADIPHIDIIINISASPFYVGKINQRRAVLSRCAKHFDCAVAYCNLVGGQDELVFDGRSMFVDSAGRVVSQAKAFAEDILVADITSGTDKKVNIESVKADTEHPDSADPIAEVYDALILGTGDYIRKNGFTKIVIGLSGGIDSALTAAIAVDALGVENVVCISMPSRFNRPETISDAEKTAGNLGVEFRTIPIADILEKFDNTLTAVAGWDNAGIAYENLQARIRGCILMSLSNQFGYLVLTTGNKSETAVGYSTLYGDTAGGFAVIKDVPKTMVYQLAGYVNKIHNRDLIPTSVIERPPSAELRQDQKDTDSLPDYDLLDRILKGYIEQDQSAQQLTQAGLSEDIVTGIIRMVDRNEYKRRQSPPGVRITPKAFGKDRRMPITNRYNPT